MELVTGGELFERLVKQGPYSEKEASRLMRQMAEAIAYLHSQGVCHRDLKPENLLLSEPDGDGEITVKLCDFGLSVALGQEDNLLEKQGTWAYWAPEMFGESRYSGKEVDMWSLGVILPPHAGGDGAHPRPRQRPTATAAFVKRQGTATQALGATPAAPKPHRWPRSPVKAVP